ncbi:MAG: alpha/beta fold hydrolase, partial [Salinivenus sp.]
MDSLLVSSTPSSPSWSRIALGAGVVAGGVFAGFAAARWRVRRHLSPPLSLPPALDWSTNILESQWGPIHYYVRPGTGPPIVLLHSFNAAASPYEMKPIADHFAETTDRPLYALDWLGFGRSG